MSVLSFKEGLLFIFLAIALLQLTACQKDSFNPEIYAEESDIGDLQQIIGGTPVQSSDSIAKSTVLLLDVEKGSLCTGNLVATNLVLTAAHCTQRNPENILVVFTQKMPQSNQDLRSMVTRRVIGGKTAQLWAKLDPRKEKDWGDIAILKFESSAPKGYAAAKLLAQKSSLRTGMNVTLAGFGITDGTRGTDTDVLRKVGVKVANAQFSQTEILLDQRQGRGACHGDSGGPAIAKINRSDVVVGVTSRGNKDPMDTCLQFSIYTNVAAYWDWIVKTAKELNSADFRGGEIAQPVGF